VAKSYRNNFSSGCLDPLLEARSDLEQYRAGLRTGTNVMLLPHGGFRRRPGLRFCRDLTGLGDPEYHGRLSRFRFNDETQYVLHWRDERVDVYQGTTTAGFDDTARITRIRTPYGNAKVPNLYLSPKSQTADTAILCHPEVAPHRLLRAALRTTNPIRTYLTSTIVRVYHPNHKLLTGDEIGLSGLTATGGITAARLNTFHEVALVSGTLGTAKIATTSGQATVVIDLDTDFDFEIGDSIALEAPSGSTVGVGGFTSAQLYRTHEITAVSSDTVTVTLPLNATSTVTGGTGATWKAASFYQIDIGGSTSGITAADGGGTAGRAWVLHSLAPDDDRDVCLEEIPQFDFEDGDSPEPKGEQARFIFDSFANGDSYKLVFSVPSIHAGADGALIQTPFIDWTTQDIEENGRRIEAEFEGGAPNSAVSLEVEYDAANSSGDHHEFILRFTPSIDVDAVDVFKIRSNDGTLTVSSDVEGGSTEEDVISDTRGWPAGCIFHQRRLWFFGLASRPSTVLASRVEDFFNFDIGTALDGDAIDATGDFDPITHLVADRGLYLLTSGSEVEIAGGDGEAITPSNIKLTPTSRYGSTSVVPTSVAGRPIYIDRTGRTVRQLGFSAETGSAESKDISILSQFYFDGPVAMDVWRNSYGDYAAVVMEDGSMAVLNINVDQGVAGWTKWTTDGDFVDVCESGDVLFAIVSRTVQSATQYFLEAFDFDYHTDAGVISTAIDQTSWSGLSHLQGRTVQVRLDAMTLSEAVVASGSVSSLNGDVPIPGDAFEGGLAIPTPTAEPMSPVTAKYASLIRAEVDLYQSRGVYVNGFLLRPLLPGEDVDGAYPSITGIRPIQLRGWGARPTVTITFPEPQPALVRAVELEVA
jgi:hypothetical protein